LFVRLVPEIKRPVAHATVQSETETEHGWSFRVVLEHPGGAPTEHSMTMSWVDYNYWSPGGTVAPERVAAWIAAFVGERREPGVPPAKFDASTVRRWFPELDRALRDGLGV
jgi:hypothetical protein